MASGGDCSGMNPATKRFVDFALEKSLNPYFIYGGLEGLIDGKIKETSHTDVAGIIHQGGTILRSSRSKRFFEKKYRQQAYDNLQAHNIEAIVVMGGNGSFAALQVFKDEFDIHFAGIPSTIDNDIYGTSYCLGVDTALNIIRESIDNIRDTASSFSRSLIVEVMGRHCGYLALVSALTSGAELCVIPEAPHQLDSLKTRFKAQMANGRDYFISVVAEGAQCTEEIKEWYKNEIGIDTRVTILGHIQRGGRPTVFERLMAFEFATYAIESILQGTKDNIVVFNDGKFGTKTTDEVNSGVYKLDEHKLCLAKDMMA